MCKQLKLSKQVQLFLNRMYIWIKANINIYNCITYKCCSVVQFLHNRDGGWNSWNDGWNEGYVLGDIEKTGAIKQSALNYLIMEYVLK